MACSADATRSVDGGAGHPIKLAEAVAEEAERHPAATIEVFATDEHRYRTEADPAPGLGAARPSARSPAAITASSGSTSPPSSRRRPARALWYLSTGVDKRALRGRPSRSSPARPAPGATGSSSSCSTAPAGTPSRSPSPTASASSILPPYTPELQPAETPLAPRRRAHRQPALRRPSPTLDAVVAERCRHPRQRPRPHAVARPASTGGRSVSARTDHAELV